MDNDWREVARLTFKGKRFEDHALDVDAMPEIVQFRRIVLETAKVVWRKEHPDRERLPKQYEDGIRFFVRGVAAGSAIVPLEIIEPPRENTLFPVEEESSDLEKAMRITHSAFCAIEQGNNLPDDFPRDLVDVYAEFGRTLADDEAVEVSAKDWKPAQVTKTSRKNWATYLEPPHSNVVDTSGEVGMADVHGRRFHLWLDDSTWVPANFSPEQEGKVIEALKLHKSVRLHVKGRGEFGADGKLTKITAVEALLLGSEAPAHPATKGPSIEEQILALAKGVPAAEWKRIPPEAFGNPDRRLYGRRKK